MSGPDKLLGRLEEARGEAQRTFPGDGSVFLERYIARARHIEVQILADVHGSVVHLWERDCSVQRRHQKVVELAPAPNLSDELRDEICAAAIRVARTTGYVNAGTVEFLVDADTGEWFFIEVNPRIQVEHTVTEVVTGIDLVRSQILVAQGCRLHKAPLSIPQQHEIPRRGTAIQCRINRGSRERVLARLRPPPDVPHRRRVGYPPRRDGRCRRGPQPVLRFAPRQAHRLGRRRFRCLHPGRPRSSGVPHPGRQDQHRVPAERGQPRGLPERGGDDALPRRDARVVRSAAGPRPSQPAAQLHR